MFLCLTIQGHIHGCVEGQPVNDSRLATRATHEYIHSRLAIRDTRELHKRRVANTIQHSKKWQSNQLDGGGMYYNKPIYSVMGKPQSIDVLLCANMRDVDTRMERCHSDG